MSELILREAYWDDHAAREAFKRFLVEIHGLDLGAWDAAGRWDPAYRPVSWFDREGRVVSSVCVYSLEMVVQGERCRAAQISGVGTIASRRREGLNRRLTEIALDRVAEDHAFVFLFANQDAVPYYARCGFSRLDEHVAWIEVEPGTPRPGLEPLDPTRPEGRARLDRACRSRAPVSRTLGVLAPRLLWFHALYTLRGLLYRIDALDVVVALRRDGSKLTLLDVIGPAVPSFDRMYPYVTDAGIREVEFSFVPDALGVAAPRWRRHADNGLHDRGDFPLRETKFVFPFTAHA